MKCHVVLDKEGRIVSVGYLDLPELEELDFKTPRFGPELEPDQTIVELDVENVYARLKPGEILERLHTDIRTKRPDIKLKK